MDASTATDETQLAGDQLAGDQLAGDQVALRFCNQELDMMRTAQGWEDLWQFASKHILHPRHALSYHTTTACQPGKALGPAGSLKDCGLENPILAFGGRGVGVRLEISHAFEHGDGLSIVYDSPPFPNLKLAQKHACLEILCFFFCW